MINSSEVKGSNILLLGYGREGKSTHQFLLSNYPNIEISIADNNQIIPIKPVNKIFSGTEYLEHLSGFSTLIRSPGIPYQSEQIQQYLRTGGHITTATNIFFSLASGTTIGVTGTKGKSTTASLIAHILSSSFPRRRESITTKTGSPIKSGMTEKTYTDVRLIGNIGYPMLDALNGATNETIFVIELSSHQLEDVLYSPHIAVVLNVFTEHMDYYQSFNQYVTAKANIVEFQSINDVVVYDDSNNIATSIAQGGKGKKIPISLYNNIPLPKTLLQGNQINIRTAIAVTVELGVPKKQILTSLKTFHPLPHRLEFVGEYQGITFYNDSLATIPEATIHAIESLGENVETLIAGGYDRKLDYTSLGEFLANRKTLKTIILFPDTGNKILSAIKLASQGWSLRSYQAQTIREAVRLAYKHTSKGKICLLSPASASFNMFKDYADRGEQFAKLVTHFVP